MRVGDTDVRVVSTGNYADAIQVDRLVERYAFTAVGASSLVFFTAVEDAVSDAEHGLLIDLIGSSETRPEIKLVPGNQGAGNLSNRNFHGRKRRGEVRRQRRVLVRSLGNEERQVLQVEIRLPRKTLVDRRPQFVAYAKVEGQLGVDLPVVLRIPRPRRLLRRNEVRCGDVAAVDLAQQRGGHGVTGLVVGRRERGFVGAVTNVAVRIGNLEEREFDRAILGAELERMGAVAHSHVFDKVPNVVEFFGRDPVVSAGLLVAAERNLRQAAVVRGRAGRIVTTDA